MPAWLLPLLAGTAAGTGLGALFGGGGDSGGATLAPRDLYREITDTLRAQEETAPRQFLLEAEYQPKYAGLSTESLRRALLGGEAGQRTLRESVPTHHAAGYYSPEGDYMGTEPWQRPPGLRAWSPGFNDPGWTYRPAHTSYEMMERVVDTPAQPGLLQLLRDDLQPMVDDITTESTRRQRAGELEMVGELGPEFIAALKQVNPGQSALADMLRDQVTADLEAGGVSEWERRQLEQAVRGAQAARGMGHGRGDAAEEAFYVADNQYRRRRENQEAARAMIGLEQALYGDPYMAITGRNVGSVPVAGGFISQGQGVVQQGGPGLFGQNEFTNDVYNTNANASVAAGIAAQNRKAGLQSGLLNAGGSILGGYLAGRN